MPNILPVMSKKEELKEALNSEKLKLMSSFLDLNWEQTAVLAGCIIFEKRNRGIILPEMIEQLSPVLKESQIIPALVHLTGLGYMEINATHHEHRKVEISVSPGIEIALRQGKMRVLRYAQMKVDQQDRELLTLYGQSICYLCKYISLVDWEANCLAFMRNSKHPLATKTRQLKAHRIDKAALIFSCILQMMNGESINLAWLAGIFSFHRVEAAKLLDNWQQDSSIFLSSGLLKMVEKSRGRIQLISNVKLSGKQTEPAEKEEKWDFEESKPAITIVKHNTIATRTLIYNKEIREKCGELSGLLNPDNFKAFKLEMLKQNQYPGVAILLSGQPGTGKTELARQLARETRRDLLMFEVSEQREMFYGQSEKKIKEIFQYYSTRCEDPEKLPILCFNEADSIFQRRGNSTGSTSQTENAIQTIMLNEMEKYEGIMICTTNVPELFDQAYSRRFLYKLEIGMPDTDTREALLRHLFPEMKVQTCSQLATSYRFSGAQLINFSRQRAIRGILSKKELSLEIELKNYLEFENQEKALKSRAVIGFQRIESTQHKLRRKPA